LIFRSMFSRQWLLTTLLVLVGGAVCVRLGIWQLDRLQQRRAFNAHVEAMWAAAPLKVYAKPANDLASMEYRAITISGTYDFEHQVVLRNQYYQSQYGYHLLTPLRLDDGTAVLVDRGWIPAEGNDTPVDWRKYDQLGRVTLQGQIRLGQTSASFGSLPDPTLAPGQTNLDFWNIVNLARIGTQMPYPLLDAFVQPKADPANDTPPIPYQPELDLSEGPHLGYAVQWFFFASILVLGYPFYLRKQLLKPSKEFKEQK
jgi:surfeit locus 1 family protein